MLLGIFNAKWSNICCGMHVFQNYILIKLVLSHEGQRDGVLRVHWYQYFRSIQKIKRNSSNDFLFYVSLCSYHLQRHIEQSKDAKM